MADTIRDRLSATTAATPVRPDGLATVVKRGADVAASLGAFVFCLPLFVAIAVVIRLQDGGPALYRHTRCGRDGQPFDLWKFRTMHVDADARLSALLNDDPSRRADWDMHHKLRDDPRVTRFGRLLRKTSLDELPQLLNILMGDMSMVGPRPITDEELARYGGARIAYEAVRPGLTGLWQVSGRNETDFATRVALDSDYVERWSLGRDGVILLRTIPAVLLGRGAY